MPRFFFDAGDGDRLSRDDEGLDFLDLAQARKAALISLAEAARDELPKGERHLFAVVIRDAEGRQLLAASLLLRIE
jgi:hypothetical protein